MKTRLILKAGKKGTEKLVNLYGESLLCVRYDEERKKRFKTVELIIDEVDWPPKKRPDHDEPEKKPGSDDRILGIRIGLEDQYLQYKVRKAGGVWDRKRRLWVIRAREVRKLDLWDRVAEVIRS